jgi:hypothetical protein
MLTIAEAQRRTELFLTGQMLEALHAVEYELPSFCTETREVQLADARARASRSAMCAGLPNAIYLVNAFATSYWCSCSSTCTGSLSSIAPAVDALDASTLADAPIAGDPGRRYVETYVG